MLGEGARYAAPDDVAGLTTTLRELCDPIVPAAQITKGSAHHDAHYAPTKVADLFAEACHAARFRVNG